MLLCHDFFFQAEDGIRDLVRSRGLGDVYKRQAVCGELEELQKSQKVLDGKKRDLDADLKRMAERLSLIHI